MTVALPGFAACAAVAVLFGAPSVARQAGSETGEIAVPLADARKQETLHRVVVSLKGLGSGPAWTAQIASSRARVMGALKNHHVQVNREYDLIPALALTVDNEALQILRSHPDVVAVAEDGTSAPGGGASSPGPVK